MAAGRRSPARRPGSPRRGRRGKSEVQSSASRVSG